MGVVVDSGSEWSPEVVECTSAETFLGEISPSAAFWRLSGDGIQPHSSWVFRGHGNASWKLVPDLFRTDAGHAVAGDEVLTHHDHVLGELLQLEDFVSVCGMVGLRVPERSVAYFSRLGGSVRLGREFRAGIPHMEVVQQHPHPDLLELMSLARHYGVPNRLLDWTTSPMVAAYFAAHGITRGQSNLGNTASDVSGFLEVWALDGHYVGNHMRCAVDEDVEGYVPVVLDLITTPTWGNSRQTAQSGLFTVSCFPQYKGLIPAGALSVEYAVRRLVTCRAKAAIHPVREPSPIMRRIQLSWHEAPRLLRLLARAGIHAGTVFPGYGGVVQYLREVESWRD
ncbi:MAG: hypothetical protein ACJAZO_000852 [Myxococcota bacterium]|jgi:hypothetical protein